MVGERSRNEARAGYDALLIICEGSVLVGRFRAETLLGRGGMGEVWRCRDLAQDGRHVAVKAVRPELVQGSWAASLFLGEVAAVARLAHRNIVPVYDLVSTPQGAHYLVMRAADGVPLSTVPAHRADWPFVRAVTRQILDALAYAHARGVLHLDIKPDNVLVDHARAEPTVVLVDFGISRIRTPGHGLPAWNADAIVGTLAYLAPERCSSIVERFGPWTDLYSLGVVMYELCCGVRPFSDGPDLQAMLARVTRPAPRLEPRFAAPEGLPDLVASLLATEPRDRPLRAHDVLGALDALGDAPLSVAPSHRPPRAADVRPDPWALAPTPGVGSRLPSDAFRAVSLVPATAPLDTSVVLPPSTGPNQPAPVVDAVAASAFLHEDRTPIGAYGLFGLRDVPVLGRSDERLALWNVVAAAVCERRPRVALLTGPAGVGKSRLARDALERAEQLGLCIGLQTAWSADGAADEGLRGLVENTLDCRGADAGAVRMRLAIWLERIAGDHRALMREVELFLRPPADAAPDAALPVRVAAELVARTSSLRPVLLWLDDVANARGEAVALLRALVAWPEPLPICVVATARGDGAESRAALEAVDGLPVSAVDLDPMTPAATRTLLHGLLHVDDQLLGALADRSEGNPLFATRLLEELVVSGDLVPEGIRYRLAPGRSLAGIPDAVGALWDARIARSGAHAEDLAALALVRSQVSLEVAERLAAALPEPARFEAALVRALRAGLLTVRRGVYAWEHGLLREHLVRTIPRSAAPRLHEAAARALEPLVGREDVQEERAQHLRFVPGREREACEALLDASQWSLARADNDRRRARLALLVEWARDAGRPELEARGLAEVAYVDAEMGIRDTVEAQVAEARLVADGLDAQTRAWVELRASQAVRLLGRLDEGREATEAALAWAREARCDAVEAVARLQRGNDAYRVGRIEDARIEIQASLEIYRRNHDRVGEARALIFAGSVAPDLAVARELVEASIALARDAGALRIELTGRQTRVEVLAELGLVDEMRQEAADVAAEAARRGLRQTVAILELCLARVAAQRDEWDTARLHRDRAGEWGARTGAPPERAYMLALDVALRMRAGEVGLAGLAGALAGCGYDEPAFRRLLEHIRKHATPEVAGVLAASRS